MSEFIELSTRPVSTRAGTLCGTSNSGTIQSVGTPGFSTGPRSKSVRNTWNGSPQRELTINTLSGKLGADQRDDVGAAAARIGRRCGRGRADDGDGAGVRRRQRQDGAGVFQQRGA